MQSDLDSNSHHARTANTARTIKDSAAQHGHDTSQQTQRGVLRSRLHPAGVVADSDEVEIAESDNQGLVELRLTNDRVSARISMSATAPVNVLVAHSTGTASSADCPRRQAPGSATTDIDVRVPRQPGFGEHHGVRVRLERALTCARSLDQSTTAD